MPGRINPFAWLIAGAALSFACNDTPADLRTWRADDHDHTENPNADQVQVSDAGTADTGHGLDDVTVVAWQQNCTSCHGPLGRGDGPQGQLVHAADLSRPDWQATVTDEVIASTIRQGRGKMPAFNLPDATITRLVALIRMLDLNHMQQAANARNGASTGTSASAPSPGAKAPPASSAATPPAPRAAHVPPPAVSR